MRDDEHDEEIVDEMPEVGGAPCGDIFGGTDVIYLSEAEDDDMPAPTTEHCGDPFGSSQTTYLTDADDGA